MRDPVVFLYSCSDMDTQEEQKDVDRSVVQPSSQEDAEMTLKQQLDTLSEARTKLNREFFDQLQKVKHEHEVLNQMKFEASSIKRGVPHAVDREKLNRRHIELTKQLHSGSFSELPFLCLFLIISCSHLLILSNPDTLYGVNYILINRSRRDKLSHSS